MFEEMRGVFAIAQALELPHRAIAMTDFRQGGAALAIAGNAGVQNMTAVLRR
ncbi:MAG: hypothetical protein AAFY26_10765 [Cyanobacteria bacterium J06638_22]